MKIVLFDFLYDTKKLSYPEIQKLGQSRLDAWLGKDNTRFEIEEAGERSIKCTLWRQYGRWYQDPKCSSNCNSSVVDFDAAIFEGQHYQTGTVADFSEHPGWAIWYPDIETIFKPEMKTLAKKHHGSRIKNIVVDNFLDHVVVEIEYV